ncbi:unnamed protein product [Tuber aestivum]|uniref:Uncharacterized protein n=1 Tax=Tuber aestivum TaxID=59557 RepID=A0A292PKN2_9PEZI|nr:unnamed protein product [Tuber aestivum]
MISSSPYVPYHHFLLPSPVSLIPISTLLHQSPSALGLDEQTPYQIISYRTGVVRCFPQSGSRHGCDDRASEQMVAKPPILPRSDLVHLSLVISRREKERKKKGKSRSGSAFHIFHIFGSVR